MRRVLVEVPILSDRSQSGSATGSVLLLLVLLSAAAAWNYHRNWQIEKESEGHRPYEAYAVDDLAALRDAYASELGGVRAQFAAAKKQRARPKRDAGSIAQNIAQFQKTAQTSSAIRTAAAGVAEREGQMAKLDRELELRSRFGEGLIRHLKRLTTI